MATIKFPPFNAYVCVGDSVTVEHQGFTIRAHIERDDDGSAPDKRQDGFWPSLDPSWIGHKSKSALARAKRKAQTIMDAWGNDEWFYCGVCVTVSRAGVELTGRYAHALWGVECNYPSKLGNAYLSEVAGEQASEALDAANAKRGVHEVVEFRTKVAATKAARERLDYLRTMFTPENV